MAMSLLDGLKGLGVRIALDDFGTGYSSLTYLRQLPLDKIKIDRSFVRDMLSQADCGSIVKSIIGLATELRLLVTAEGVETAEQLAYLRRLGCAEAQGELISAPLDMAQVDAMFGGWRHWRTQVG